MERNSHSAPSSSRWQRLAMRVRVLEALAVRDMMMRYGRGNLGFLWVLLEPMILTVGVMFYPVWHKQQDMRLRVLQLETELKEKTAALHGHQGELDLLRNDREYLETIARDRLNLMKPGETVFRIEMPRS